MEGTLYLREIKGGIITVIVLNIMVIFHPYESCKSSPLGCLLIRTMDSLSCFFFPSYEIPDSLQNKNTPIETFLLSLRKE